MKPIRGLSFWRHAGESWLVLALKGYCDESGDEKDPQHAAISVAGYLAPVERWATFETAWQSVLDSPQFSVPYLHMKELSGQTGAFCSWNKRDPKVAALLGALAETIGAGGLSAFGATIPMRDLKRFNERYGLEINGKSFALYALAAEIRKRYPLDDIEVVLDRMSGGHRMVSIAEEYSEGGKIFPGIRKFPMFIPLPKDGERNSRNMPPLQAADFLAWELRKNYENKKEWFEQDPPPSPSDKNWSQSLWKWFLDDRMGHLIRHGLTSIDVPLEPLRRSLIALDSASTIRGLVWSLQGLEKLYEARAEFWGDAEEFSSERSS